MSDTKTMRDAAMMQMGAIATVSAFSVGSIGDYIGHLEALRDGLERRVAELEAEKSDVITWTMFKARAEKAEREIAELRKAVSIAIDRIEGPGGVLGALKTPHEIGGEND